MHLNDEKLSELDIEQLNNLVINLEIKDYYHLARMRTLKYSPEVIENIAKHCTVESLFEILKKCI